MTTMKPMTTMTTMTTTRDGSMLTRLLPLLSAVAIAASACGPLSGASMQAAAAPDSAASADAPAERFSVYELGSEWLDQSGEPVQLASLAGKVRVVAMVYTSCHATCPLIVRDLKAIEAKLPPERRDDVGFVLVSIDPERDTPGRLAEWAAGVQLDPRRWTLLAGSDDSVRELAASLDVRYQTLQNDEIAHTNAVTVLDADGGVAHRRTGLDEPVERTADAVARLLH